MKILSLDLGDKWVGSALSDPLGITCKPYQTVERENLEQFLKEVLAQEDISTVVVGYPQTLSGTQSEQTKKIVALKEKLEQQFKEVAGKTIQWILWDERLSSKRAEKLKRVTTKEEKRQSHSVAAAFILQSYLDHKAL